MIGDVPSPIDVIIGSINLFQKGLADEQIVSLPLYQAYKRAGAPQKPSIRQNRPVRVILASNTF